MRTLPWSLVRFFAALRMTRAKDSLRMTKGEDFSGDKKVVLS